MVSEKLHTKTFELSPEMSKDETRMAMLDMCATVATALLRPAMIHNIMTERLKDTQCPSEAAAAVERDLLGCLAKVQENGCISAFDVQMTLNSLLALTLLRSSRRADEEPNAS